jgi:sugar (pentulose or hexulose) kinase
MLLGIDVGTTHCKAGVFQTDGTSVAMASFDMPSKSDLQGNLTYDPDAVWNLVQKAITQVLQDIDRRDIQAVGVTSMAETGLLIDPGSGTPRTDLIPWHSKIAGTYVDSLAFDASERFSITGIRPSYKCGLAKILWLRDQNSALLDGALWLSTADYIVYRLTGVFVTDYSLAGRTYAFNITQKCWDAAWLARFGISEKLFPPAESAGAIFPALDVLAPGTTVCVAGHDHVCAALAVGAISPDVVLDSMGTAETLVGVWSGAMEVDSGLLFGCHVIPDHTYWMGSVSASGGSVEWLRGLFGGLSYDAIESLLDEVEEPSGIFYFPYLAGSRADSRAKASFIGLASGHQQAHVLKAALEGTAYEIEHLRQTVKQITRRDVARLVAVGGGTRSKQWMQIKADVSGCAYQIFHTPEAALLGAALVAGIGAAIYPDAAGALRQISGQLMTTIQPNLEKHRIYCQLFEEGYLKLMRILGSG